MQVLAMSRLVGLTMAALTMFAASSRAGVLVVDAAGGGDFVELQPAIQAAAQGDTILVRPPGSMFELWTVTGKSLTIVGDVAPGSDTLVFLGNGRIRNLVAGQQVVLRHLVLESTFPTAGLSLENNAGSVWVEDCTAFGGRGSSSAWQACIGSKVPGGPGLNALNCASVTVLRSHFHGGDGSDAFIVGNSLFVPTSGGPGGLFTASHVALHASMLSAGDAGGGTFCGQFGEAGTGLQLVSAKTLLSGVQVEGGALAGTGLSMDGGSSLEQLDATLIAGASGTSFVNMGGSVVTFPGAARSVELDSPVREQQHATLSLHGVPGDFVGFFWSFASASIPLPARNGWFLLSSSPFLAGPFFIGAIPAGSGTWDIPFTAPDLVPSLEAQTFLLQAWFQYPGGVTLGSGTGFTLLDAGY